MDTTVAEPPVATAVLAPLAAGLLLGGLCRPGSAWAAIVVAIALAAMPTLRRRPARAVAAALAAGVALGTLSAALAQGPLPADHLARFVGPGTVAVAGTIARSDAAEPRTALAIRVEHVRSRRRSGPASGLLGVTIAHARRPWIVGDRVRVVGRLRRPRNFGNPGGYDMESALARRGIRVTMFLWDDDGVERLAASASGVDHRVARVRAAVTARLVAQAGEPARGYLTAVLLGAAQGLDRETRAALTRTGLAHVVSVSGFHVAVTAGACFFALRWLALRLGMLALHCDVATLAAVAGVIPVATYAAIAGGSVPAARAFLMYAVLLGALACGRPADGVRALAVAAILLSVPAPDIAADVSFELSFLSVLALVMVTRGRSAAPSPDSTARADRRSAWWRTLVVQPLQTSLAATAVTAPLTAWHFQQVSLIAPLANLVALPLLGPATLLPGLAALPVIGIAPWLADGLLTLAGQAAALGLALAAWLARFPWAAVSTPMPSLFELALCYAALALWWFRPGATDGAAPPTARSRRIAVVVVAFLWLGDATYWLWERCGDPSLRVTFLSVGQGDAAIVELPRGGVLAIDGGGFAGDFDPGERLIAPFLRSRKVLRLDAVALSHPQLDHYGGLTYLARHFVPRELWWNGMRASATAFAELEAALATAGTRSVVLTRGMRRRLGADVVLDVLHPGATAGTSANDASLVLRLTFGATSVLFAGDVERAAEREMLARGVPLASQVLKVPHHGSATSSTRAWLAAVAPAIAVVSSGTDNRFGFPAPEVVRRLRDVGATVWSTAESGAVRVVSDGRRVHVEAAR